MQYEELISNICKQENLRINHSGYDEEFFGNFYIDITYSDRLDIQVVRDRGVVEIDILFSCLFFKTQIPLSFAVNYVKHKSKTCREFTFNSLGAAQEYLLNNIDTLDVIVSNNLMKKIVRRWSSVSK